MYYTIYNIWKVITISEKKRYLVTSALPYVHGLPHLGNIVGSVLPADVYSRYLKLKGHDAIYICGSDQHGTSLEIEAYKNNLDVHKFAMESHDSVEYVLRKWNMDFDFYGHTHSKTNQFFTDDIFLKLYEKKHISKKDTIQAYCLNDKMFLADRLIEGECPKCHGLARGDQCTECDNLIDPEELIKPYCVLCKKPDIEFRKTTNFYLNLPHFSDKLKSWITSHKEWPDIVRNNSLSLIDQGLLDRAITRDIKWGFPVPLEGYEDKVIYVWFDAPIGYISFTAEWAAKKGDIDLWKKYWQSEDSQIVQFMGKDNWIFHSIIFPAMLMGTEDNWHLADYLAVSAFLNAKGFKFSKSLGVGLNAEAALDIRDSDYWRYVLMALYPEKHDSEFSIDQFSQIINTELADVVGNLVHRTLVFIKNNYDNKVPNKHELDDKDKEFAENWAKQVCKIDTAYSKVKLREAVQETMNLARMGNVYLQEKEPWKVMKEDKVAAGTSLYILANFVRSLAILFEPVTPKASEEIWKMLNLEGSVRDAGFSSAKEFMVEEGHVLSESKALFNKIDKDELAALKSKFETSDKQDDKKEKEGSKMIKYEDFAKLDIKVGTIKSVEEIPKKDRLLKLMVDCGEPEMRQIIAGIKGKYSEDSLLNRQVVVLCNLEPKKLAGMESQGMILAAGDKDFCLLMPEEKMPEGTPVS